MVHNNESNNIEGKNIQIDENQSLKNNSEITEVQDSKRAVSFFKLQYSLLKKFDVFMIFVALMGSFGMGIAMPLFSIIFGGSINSFGASSANPNTFLDDIKALCAKFVYVGLGMWAAGYIMIWLWGLNGRIIAKRIKKRYFKLLMNQEQGYFDTKDTYQFATKIQAQVQYFILF
jgi:ATP-binding cassette subfamily B (MDR/TAP) protein 1